MLYILYGIVVVAAIIGFAEIIGLIEHKLVFGRRRLRTISLVPLYGHIENIELVVRSVVSTLRWNSCGRTTDIFLVDVGMDKETRRICDLMSDDLGGISVCDQSNLDELLSMRLNKDKEQFKNNLSV